METATQQITNELNRRTALINDPKFQQLCWETLSAAGLSKSEFMRDKVFYYGIMANEIVRKMDKAGN
jgi:hypothetical protein